MVRKSKDKPLLLKASTVAIEYPVNTIVGKVYFLILQNGKDNNYKVGSSTKSVATCHKCRNKGHTKKIQIQ